MVVHIVTIIVHVELLVSGVVVQVGILILEPLKGNTYEALLFGFSVIHVEYLFHLDINCSDCIKYTTHHERIAHTWLISDSLPFFLYPKGSLIYFSNDHPTAGLLCGVGHPQTGFVGRKVKVLIGRVRVRESVASLGNHPMFIFHAGEIQFGQSKRIINLIIQSIFTYDKIVSCTIPAAL